MTKENALKIAAELFPTYPSVNTFHITHDGQAFEDATQAGNHARQAFKKDDERTVIAVTREEAATISEPVKTQLSEEEEAKKAAIEKAEENVKVLGKKVAGKEKALDKASDDKKPAIEQELNAAKAELQIAEAELAKLLEGAE